MKSIIENTFETFQNIVSKIVLLFIEYPLYSIFVKIKFNILDLKKEKSNENNEYVFVCLDLFII